MLTVHELEAHYGDTKVLYGVSFDVGAGQVVSLLGRNGMGKTTTVRSIMGLTPPSAGSIRLQGRELRGMASHRIARAGAGLVPEGRQIFPNLSTLENLEVARPAQKSPGSWDVERVFALFPLLTLMNIVLFMASKTRRSQLLRLWIRSPVAGSAGEFPVPLF